MPPSLHFNTSFHNYCNAFFIDNKRITIRSKRKIKVDERMHRTNRSSEKFPKNKKSQLITKVGFVSLQGLLVRACMPCLQVNFPGRRTAPRDPYERACF